MKEKTGEIYFKICSKCKIEKPFDFFNNDKNRKDGKQRYCKECRNKQKREWNSKKKQETKWVVYILPEEHYAGISNNLYKRIANHAHSGKDVKNWYIYAEFDRPELAIIIEAILHLQGYKGCAYNINK